ncbi:uncharacterized protein LOC123322091 [Coccinella septempunctata]|uniref:uncharacterized protein LOC123322091 n=1 Tax=Coccinella septempunctata TaxID=41139 RepID=UPI001D05F0DC|nr:uncharacterized protein LOC123322091 [Coccinella septempunctata]
MDAKLLKSLMEKKSNETANNRLESLRLPRDLSLGGTKPKKIYQPNLNAQRTKHKAKESIKKLQPTKKEKPKPQPKKKVLDSKRFVQSQGVFSEGSALEKRSTGFSERTKYEYNSPSHIAIPTFTKTDSVVDDDKEDNILTSLINMKVDRDERLDNAEVWNFTPLYNSCDKVEMEPVDPYFCKVEEAEVNTRLALIKMPESLAGKGLSDDPNVTKALDYHLNMMTEGKIGSLQITRSGKMYMKIGKMRYLMESSHFSAGPETIATYMDAPNGESKPKFAFLGDVEGRFKLIPKWKESIESV